MSEKPYIVVVGPTASGKSQLAVALAHALSGEIINADAMQVYKELHIGAAKLTKDEMCDIPHHLMDVVSVGESFTVADYKAMAMDCIQDIQSRGHVPIVCGGTGLYINALTGKLDFTAVQGDPALRAELTIIAESEGKQALLDRLKTVDPVSAARLHPNDQKRVIRALEVTMLTGHPYSEHAQCFVQNAYADHPIRMVGLKWERKALEQRIRLRVDQMMDQGLLEEARALYSKIIPLEHPSMMGLGYRQLFAYFNGESTLTEAVEQIKVETRRFAKRQMTWFSRDLRIHWFEMDTQTNMEALMKSICDLYEATKEDIQREQ